MRISDWSSDVCSSDLQRDGVEVGTGAGGERRLRGAVAVDEDQRTLAAEAAQVGERAGLGRAARLRAELADRVEVGGAQVVGDGHFAAGVRSEEPTSELQSLMRTSYAGFCLTQNTHTHTSHEYTSETQTTHTLN